ncbi:TPA: hypothetical protein DIV48_00495 [Candidatus Kaiserbacteria bacterium]|nr:hypothetical protein [Candidatus Kaiserbacteria bacterium]
METHFHPAPADAPVASSLLPLQMALAVGDTVRQGVEAWSRAFLAGFYWLGVPSRVAMAVMSVPLVQPHVRDEKPAP